MKLLPAEVLAVEYYPPQSELVNDKNIYWLWIIEDQPRYKQITQK